MELLLAKTILPICAPPIRDAALLIDGGKVQDIGPRREVQAPQGTPVTDLGDAIVLPGLINAHCHLDYTLLRNALLGSQSFADWILRINALKRSLDLADYARAIETGIAQSLHSGTTTIANIETFPELLNSLPLSPLRIIWCLEMMDIRNRNPTDDFATGCLHALEPSGTSRRNARHLFGLSPHAPYTASPALYQIAAEVAMTFDLLFTTHVSESAEEMEMFAEGSGSLHALISSLSDSFISPGQSPLAYLLAQDALPDKALLVHMNGLSTGDLSLLREVGARRGFSVAHCPQSHAFFDHPPFPFEAIDAAGINVCLGTDSLGSSPSLNMFDEMRIFSSQHPAVPPWRVLRLATMGGAKALGLAGIIGCLAPGCAADLVAIPEENTSQNPYDTVIAFGGIPLGVYADGRRVLPAD